MAFKISPADREIITRVAGELMHEVMNYLKAGGAVCGWVMPQEGGGGMKTGWVQ